MKLGHAVMVMVAGIVKFLFSPAVSYGFKHSYWETFFLTAAGGCLGMALFFLSGRQVLEVLRKRRLRKRALAISRGQRPKRIFTRTNRTIVRLKQAYGPQGVAFLLTPLLSVPLTALVAAKYFHNNKRTLPILMAAVVVWSLVLSVAWKFIH